MSEKCPDCGEKVEVGAAIGTQYDGFQVEIPDALYEPGTDEFHLCGEPLLLEDDG